MRHTSRLLAPGHATAHGHRQSAFQPVAQAASAGDLVLGQAQGAMGRQAWAPASQPPALRTTTSQPSPSPPLQGPRCSLPRAAPGTLWGAQGPCLPRGRRRSGKAAQRAARALVPEERLKVLAAGPAGRAEAGAGHGRASGGTGWRRGWGDPARRRAQQGQWQEARTSRGSGWNRLSRASALEAQA